jgi:adhesin transport system outer membrane protein
MHDAAARLLPYWAVFIRSMRLILISLAALCLAQGAHAQGQQLTFTAAVDAQSFRQAVRMAVDSNPAVKGAISQRQEAKAARREAKSNLLPTIGVGLNGQQELTSSFGDDPDTLVERSRPRQRLDATVSGQQLLFDSGATFARMDAARQRMSEAEAQTQVAAAEIALQAIQAYLEVVQFRQLKLLSEELVNRHQDILDQVTERYDNGVGSIQDVARVAARKATAQAQLAGFDRGLARAKSRYQQLFQEEAGEFDRPKLLPAGGALEEDKIAMALTANPLMARAAANSRAARLDQKAIERGNLPSLSVAVDATKFGVFEGQDQYDVRGRLVMDYDLFQGGARRARERQAFQRTRQAEFNEDRTRQEVERDVRIAMRDLEVLNRQLETLAFALDANKSARDAFVEQFAVARGTLLDLLQAEADYFAAAIDLLNGRLDRDMAHYQLMAQTGELLDVFGVSFSFATSREIWGQGN